MSADKGNIYSYSYSYSVSSRGRASLTILVIWVLVVVSQLGFCCSEESGKVMATESSSFVTRKVRFLATKSLFHPPLPSKPTPADLQSNNSSSVYEDDKRIIHTGPNPLHN